MAETAGVFDDEFRRQLHELMVWRRDVRRFRRDPVPDGTLEKLLQEASLAPSVGLSEPWRFVIVDSPERRISIREIFLACNAEALASYSEERAKRYAELKLAGLDEAPLHFAAFADRSTLQGHGLGRRTMPETAEYSTAAAILAIWLLARAQGLGLGWVSILDPAAVIRALDLPAEWRFIGYFCFGYPAAEDDVPALERAGWEKRHDPAVSVLRR